MLLSKEENPSIVREPRAGEQGRRIPVSRGGDAGSKDVLPDDSRQVFDWA